MILCHAPQRQPVDRANRHAAARHYFMVPKEHQVPLRWNVTPEHASLGSTDNIGGRRMLTFSPR
jgi:hypothetical protein